MHDVIFSRTSMAMAGLGTSDDDDVSPCLGDFVTGDSDTAHFGDPVRRRTLSSQHDAPACTRPSGDRARPDPLLERLMLRPTLGGACDHAMPHATRGSDSLTKKIVSKST